MYKLILLLFSFFYFLTSSFSQSLLVSYVSGDCVKCQIILESVLRKNTSKIPLFYVFPKVYESDSTGIRTSNNFKESDKLVFSNTYSKLIESKSVSVAYLSSNNTILFKKSVLELKPTDAQFLDSLYANDFFYKSKNPLIERFKDGWKVTKNQATSAIIVDSLNLQKKILINDTIVTRARKSVEHINPDFFKLTKDAIDDGGIPNSYLKAVIVDHFFSNGILYYHITIPYIAPPTKEELDMGAKGGIDKCHVIAIDKIGADIEFYPILNSSFGRGELSSRPSFIVNGNSLYCFEYYTDSERENVDRRYISEYTFEKDKLVFKKRLMNTPPEVLFTYNVKHSLLPSFMAIEYPFFAPTIGTRITNLNTETDYDFNPKYKIDYSGLNAEFAKNFATGQSKMPMENRYLFTTATGLYLITKVDSTYHLNVFNVTEGKVEFSHTVNLNSIGLEFAEYPIIFYDKLKKLFYYENNSGYIHSIPLELISI